MRLRLPDNYHDMSHIYHFKDVHSHDTKPDTVRHRRSLEREPNCVRDGQPTVTQTLAMRVIIEEAKKNNLTAVSLTSKRHLIRYTEV